MATLREIGRVGQNRFGGVFREEFLRELQGRHGIQTYREMSENDDIVGAVLSAIELLCRQVTWQTQPAGDSAKDRESAEFIDSCMDDMSDTWTDTISEILSFLTYGWSAHEIVYKRRIGDRHDPRLKSKYTDRLIGWQKIPVRAQDTLYEWEYDGNDNLIGMTQMPPPDYGLITIPADRLLLFRTKSRKANPEGRSILRNAYRSWYFKRRIQEIEGIGIERDLAGFPVLKVPPDIAIDIWNTEDPEACKLRADAENLVQNIRRDSLEGIVLPAGWELELVSTGGARQFDTNAIIDRYDNRIAMTMLADFILLGHENTGSWALSSDKTDLFAMAIGSYLDIICEAFNNQAIPRLIDINGEHFSGITDYPMMMHGDIETPELDKLGEFLSKVTGAGILLPDEGIEDYVRQAANLPERMNDWNEQGPSGHPERPSVRPGDNGRDELPEDGEPPHKAAKRRLGRA